MEAIQTTKQVSNDLSPHILANYGIASAVENFIKKITDHIEIRFESNLENVRFDNSLETTFYRIVKELINNTIKHAKAKNIQIALNKKRNKLLLNYSDDGIGFDINTIEKRGMGLYNLMSRIKSLDGKFEFERLDIGIKIRVDAPIVQ
jgi:signal transduction histidine kinase